MKKYKFLPFLAVLVVSNSLAEDNLITSVEEMNGNTICHSSKWGDEDVNSCLCCVVQNAPQSQITASIARNILKECDKSCPLVSRKEISDKYDVSMSYPHEFVKAIIRNNLVNQ